MANGAVLHASRELREKVLSLAADVLEASAADLQIDEGRDQRQGFARRHR